MRKITLAFIFCFTSLFAISQTFVPDDAFEQRLIDLGYDSGPLDDFVPTANINTVTNLALSNIPVVDLTGLEDFAALDNLFIRNTNVTTLDVTSNLLLTGINCNSNNISTININGLVNLEELILFGNSITTIDLSTNAALKTFNGGFNPYTTLDFSNNLNMEFIGSPNGSLTSINVIGLMALEEVYIQENQITTLDVNGLNNLWWLDARENVLTSVNLTGATAMEFCFVADNQLSLLDVSTNTSLLQLSCGINQLATIDVSNNSNLLNLEATFNNLTSIVLTGANALDNLRCNDNLLTALDVTSNLNLNRLTAFNNNLGNVDLSNNAALTFISINDNNLTSLNVQNGNNTAIPFLNAINNPGLFCIEVDDVAYSNTNWPNIDPQTSFNTSCVPMTFVPDDAFEQQLIDLGYDSGPLDDHVITANINTLLTIDLEDQDIADLTGIEDFTALESLYCHTNLLTSIDVSFNVNLTTLVCGGNALTTLDVTQNPNLEVLSCGNNQLSTLLINPSSVLTELIVLENMFTSFDASIFSSLIDFRCQDNQLTSLNVKNGNNTNFILFNAESNPGLLCIEVDDVAYANTNWTNIDPVSSFSLDCALFGMTYVPDDAFETYLINNGYDTGSLDDYVPTANINGLTTIDVTAAPIADFTGIEDFTALTSLLMGNASTAIFDVSTNLALEQFGLVNTSAINTVDVSTLTNLEILFLDNNTALTVIDVDNTAALIELTSTFNPGVTGIDISNNLNLQTLVLNDNAFTSLDLTTNTDLVDVSVSNNQLTTLSVSTLLDLESIVCDNNSITGLDLTQNTNLTKVTANDNALTTMDMRNGTNTAIINFNILNNLDLVCVSVDDAVYSNTNWINKDATTSYADDCLLGINSLHITDLILFPNPASEILRVENLVTTNATFTIVDITGKMIQTGVISEKQIQISELSSGVYFITISEENNYSIKQFIKN